MASCNAGSRKAVGFKSAADENMAKWNLSVAQEDKHNEFRKIEIPTNFPKIRI